MKIAIQEAIKAQEKQEVPIGAVIVNSLTGHIIAAAGNQVICPPDPTGHAELIALRIAALKLTTPRLIECDLYTTLEPCPMCAQAIGFARIKNLYIGALDPKGGGVFHGPKIFEQSSCHHKKITVHYTPFAEASNLLKTFFKSKRNEKR